MASRFVAYIRVSTDKQGRSGLGLEAQSETVANFVARQGGEMAARFVEIESGKRNDRPQLEAALAACRSLGAILVIAKVDRLARNARFLLTVVEGVGDAGVVFCDMPTVPAGPVGKFMLTQLAAVAELEAGLTSERTKAALAAAKARGVVLGNPDLRRGSAKLAAAATAIRSANAADKASEVLPYIIDARRAGASTLRELAEALGARGVRTPRGTTSWRPVQVQRVLRRAETGTA